MIKGNADDAEGRLDCNESDCCIIIIISGEAL